MFLTAFLVLALDQNPTISVLKVEARRVALDKDQEEMCRERINTLLPHIAKLNASHARVLNECHGNPNQSQRELLLAMEKSLASQQKVVLGFQNLLDQMVKSREEKEARDLKAKSPVPKK
jgi:hypothetical protein